MKVILLAAMTAMCAVCQPSCIQITDTLGALGAASTGLMNGTIDLTLNYSTQAGGGAVVQSAARATVVNGALSYCAPPSSTLTAVYQVRRPAPLSGAVSFTRYWTIPPAGGPYTLLGDAIETATVTIPAVTALPASRILAPPVGAFLIESLNGVTSWGPAGGHVHSSFLGHRQNFSIGHKLNSEISLPGGHVLSSAIGHTLNSAIGHTLNALIGQ